MKLRAALAALLVLAVCAVAGPALWDTVVPDALKLPHVPQSDFDAATVEDAEAYEAVARWLVIASYVALVAVLAVYVRRGPALVRESAAGPIGTGFMLGILGFSLVWLAQWPFGLASFLWAQKYDLVEVSVVEWVLEQFAMLASTALSVSLILLLVMGFAKLVGGGWFLPAAAAFAAILFGFSYVQPWLVAETLDRPGAEVRADARELARETDLPAVDVHVEEVSEWTSQPNAYAFGLGDTRKVVLWDTLVRDFDRDEVRVVLAHELGHHEHRHIAKSVWWMVLLALPAGLVVAVVTRRGGGLRDPRAVPLALLVYVLFQLATLPISSTWSRRLEAEADWAALEATKDPAAMERLFKGFTEEGMADPDPPGWWETIFDSHPSGADRVAMARAWRQRQDR